MHKPQFVMLGSEEFNSQLLKVDSLASELQKLNQRLGQLINSSGSEYIPPKLLTPPQAAKLLGKSLATIYLWRKKGIIKAHKVAGSTFFDYDELLAVVKS
jgi:excisionase family DNA binding protein